jgi:23S rRNA pseudouridine2605 synthase
VYLSKFLSTSGVCARRKATEAIKSGNVTVNDKVILEPFYVVKPDDEVCFEGQLVQQAKKFVYILLNKPENCITTVSDEHSRRTVFDIINFKTSLRIYPVGRLDRMTTGLLLLTNDGELTKKLTHPSYQFTKKYSVTLDRLFQSNDFAQLQTGVMLDDGFIKPDAIYYKHNKIGNKVIVEIHSGQNRIVRRMFEHFGYKVEKLDRFFYAGLTTKDLAVGKWRHLTPREVKQLRG